ncbi:MAG: hypothetical protein NVSMB55_22730 [Mycobacteriales bacterium]
MQVAGSRGLCASFGMFAAAAVLAGCGTGGAPHLAAGHRTPQDVPQHASAARSGHLLITPLAGRCGIFAISGTHALLDANGQFCRLRVRVESSDSSEHDFAPGEQALLLADGTSVLPSRGAMSVKRQPATVPLGAEDGAELVLWWEVPAAAIVTGVRLVGDHDADAAGAFVAPATNRAGSVVPLRGLTPTPAATPTPTATPTPAATP